MFQVKAKIIQNKQVKKNFFHLLVDAPEIAGKALPGQFLNIKVSDNLEPLLRRPLGVHRVSKNNIAMLYEVVGNGTQILSQRKAGEYLDIIGPLGNGFDYQSPVTCHLSPVLVAGGMGVAPLLFLADFLAHSKSFKSLVFIGAKTKSQLTCVQEFRELGCKVKIATDDGSMGFKGRVSDLLTHFLQATGDRRQATIFSCGPRPMLKAVSEISRKFKIPAQISLEEHMSCGIGACMGCVVQTTSGYKRICKEGPVFHADEIVWEREK
ncbi:MAG: dihydroorotate dehydrogenase electron transfer subunit [Candidatus Omnitrophica bacterium]|nr:dihydroorotate dehydrogenase electron transfer subunit [Candidatus Omnitrophota bacterium]